MRQAIKCAAGLAVLIMAATLSACGSGSASMVASGESFCDAVVAYASLAKGGAVGVNIDSSMSDEEVDRRVTEVKQQLREQVAQGRSILADIESRAPADIRADVTLVVQTELRYLDALEEHDYDPFALLSDPMFGVQSAAATAAQRVNHHTEDACGTALKPHLDEIGTITSTVGTPGTPGSVPAPPPPPSPPPPPRAP